MQNSRVIRRVNASLSRCLSHHRRLIREIDELDRLLFNDEFLRDPRTHWLLQNRQKEPELVDLTSSEELKRSQMRLLVSGSSPEVLPGSSSDSAGSYQRKRRNSTYRVPTPTPLRRPSSSREDY